jgi:hypothetical protein
MLIIIGGLRPRELPIAGDPDIRNDATQRRAQGNLEGDLDSV